MTYVIIALGILIIISAIAAVLLKNVLAAIIASGAVSLLASIIYIILSAPDVAMTEAAIGSGLTTIVFLYALSRVKSSNEKGDVNDR